MKALVAIHGLAEAAINAIACFSECCYLTGRDHIATSFQSIRIDYKGFGFDFSVEELDWRHDGDVVTEADLKALNDMLRNKLSQYELILTRMRDKYADAADGLEA